MTSKELRETISGRNQYKKRWRGRRGVKRELKRALLKSLPEKLILGFLRV